MIAQPLPSLRRRRFCRPKPREVHSRLNQLILIHSVMLMKGVVDTPMSSIIMLQSGMSSANWITSGYSRVFLFARIQPLSQASTFDSFEVASRTYGWYGTISASSGLHIKYGGASRKSLHPIMLRVRVSESFWYPKLILMSTLHAFEQPWLGQYCSKFNANYIKRITAPGSINLGHLRLACLPAWLTNGLFIPCLWNCDRSKVALKSMSLYLVYSSFAVVIVSFKLNNLPDMAHDSFDLFLDPNLL